GRGEHAPARGGGAAGLAERGPAGGSPAGVRGAVLGGRAGIPLPLRLSEWPRRLSRSAEGTEGTLSDDRRGLRGSQDAGDGEPVRGAALPAELRDLCDPRV